MVIIKKGLSLKNWLPKSIDNWVLYIVPGAGDPQSYNRYSYVSNNSIRYTDPTGYCKSTDTDYEECENYANIAEQVLADVVENPKDFHNWDKEKLKSLLLWMTRGVHFTKNDVSITRNGTTTVHQGQKWTTDEILYVVNGLDEVYNYFTSNYGETEGGAMAIKALGLDNGNTLTFNKYLDTDNINDKGESLPGFTYDPSTNTINANFFSTICCFDFTDRIIHELGHAVDRNAARAGNTGTTYWTDKEGFTDTGGGTRESYANQFRDLVRHQDRDRSLDSKVKESLKVFRKP